MLPLGVSPERDERGLPKSGTRLGRLCRGVVWVATAWLLFVGIWEIAAPFGAGHAAVVPARGIIAENMLTWGIPGPVRTYAIARPGPEAYYAHHPWGSFWMQALMMAVFGRHEVTFRILPVLTTAATPWLLYGVARALYGPVAGALAAAGYAALPIVLAFAAFPGFEGPVVVGCLLTSWGGVRLLQTGAWRWLGVVSAGMLWGLHADWEYYVFAALVLGALLVLHLVLPRRWFGEVARGPLLAWAGVGLVLTLASLALYYWLFREAGGVEALLAQGRFRSGTHRTSLSEVLERRAYWIEVMFTPLAILVGKLALPVFLARLVLLRRSGEVFPLAILAMASVHYVVFENGATIHIYWPLPYAAYFPLALGMLGHVLAHVLGFAMAASRTGPPAPAFRLAFASAGLVPLLMLPDAWRALDYARNTGLRLNDNGHLNLQDFDKAAAFRYFAERIPEGQVVALHPSVFPNWAQEWILRRPVRISARPPPPGPSTERFLLLDTRFTGARQLRQFAMRYSITAVSTFWLVDGQGPEGSILAYGLKRREPELLERFLKQAHDPVYSLERDPWLEWELRAHLGRTPKRPEVTPTSPDALRVAHNVALAGGETRVAEAHLTRLLVGCDRGVRSRHDTGIELLAACYEEGVVPRLTLHFRSERRLAEDWDFEVRSIVEAAPAPSWVRRDGREQVVIRGFGIPPVLWRPGFIYAQVIELRRRPGRERLYGEWMSRDASHPSFVPGRTEPVELLVLP